MPKIVDVDLKRAEIAEKATALLARDGILETNLGKVADQCGMGRTTLYLYFKNLGELIDFTLEETFDRLSLESAALIRETGPSSVDKILRLMQYLETFILKEKDRMVIVLDFLLHPTRNVPGATFNVQAHVRTLRSGLEEVITEAVEHGEIRPIDPASMAFTLFSFIEAATVHAVLYDKQALSGTMRDITVLIEGLKVR